MGEVHKSPEKGLLQLSGFPCFGLMDRTAPLGHVVEFLKDILEPVQGPTSDLNPGIMHSVPDGAGTGLTIEHMDLQLHMKH